MSRRPERLPKIYKYFKENDKHLAGILNLDPEGKNFKKVKKAFHNQYEELFFFHINNPDLRFGQCLIVKGITPDLDGVFSREESSYLIENGCFEQRDFMLWGTYGKSGKDSIQYKFVDELTSEHIQNIFYDGVQGIYQKVFKEILIERENK